jgi:hypothetical protein
MVMEKIEYHFISIDSKYYLDAVDLRYRVFFQPTNSPISGVYDNLEDISYHLVATLNDKVVGYFRLSIDESGGKLSQFVIEPNMRGKGSIAKNLFDMMVEKAKENDVHKLWGEIRLHVAEAAKIYGFIISDEVFPSPKTGIPHKRIEKFI